MTPPLHARRQQTSAEHFCSRLLWATQGMKRTMQLRTRVVLYGEVSIFSYSSILSKQVCFLHILFAMQVYHSVLPNYILKRIRFSILGMIGHAHLAALDDVNVNRRHSTTKKTAIGRYKVQFSKHKEDCGQIENYTAERAMSMLTSSCVRW